MRVLIALLAAAVTLPGTPVKAEEPVQTCTGRVRVVKQWRSTRASVLKSRFAMLD